MLRISTGANPYSGAKSGLESILYCTSTDCLLYIQYSTVPVYIGTVRKFFLHMDFPEYSYIVVTT